MGNKSGLLFGVIDNPSIEKLIKLSLMALAITPLVVVHSTLFPFIFGKAVFIRLMITIAGVLFAVGVLKKNKFIKLQSSRLINPFAIAQIIFIFLVLVSTFLSTNPFRSFWGDIERSEGFLILVYSLLFFLGTLLFFHREDWLKFFKVNLLVGGLVTIDALATWLGGGVRPEGSFLGNPTFLSMYALFALFFALMVGILDQKKIWLYLSRGIVLTSIATILIAGTRGVMVGLIVALLVTLFRLSLTTRKELKVNVFGRTASIKKISTTLLLVTFIFFTIFIFTINNPIWQKVPGLDRLAKISSTDESTQTRLINLGVSLDAMNPANVGIIRTLFGWGPEGYINAHSQFYNPSIQKYENSWFDRAHNKILDVLVMNGLLGLLGYLFVWTLLVWKTFSVKLREDHEQSNRGLWTSLVIGGVAVAYFVQNLFVFDQIAIYIPLFSLLSFATYTYYIKDRGPQSENIRSNGLPLLIKLGSVALGVLLVASFIWTSAIPMYQMGTMLNGLKAGHFDIDDIEKIAIPNNFIQSELRLFALFNVMDKFPEGEMINILPRMINLGEEAIERANSRARGEQAMGMVYNTTYKIFQNEAFLALGEEHLRNAINLAPGRQDTMFYFANNLVAQGKIGEAVDVADDIIVIEPYGLRSRVYWIAIVAPSDWDDQNQSIDQLIKYYDKENIISLENEGSEAWTISKMRTNFSMIRGSYNNYLNYFFRTKDSESFLKTAKQALRIENTIRSILQNMVSMGILSKLPDDGVESMENLIEAFKLNGWLTIEP